MVGYHLQRFLGREGKEEGQWIFGKITVTSPTFVCTICKHKENSEDSFVDHFNRVHKLSSNLYFTYGIVGCTAKLFILDRFKAHVKLCHSDVSQVATDPPSSSVLPPGLECDELKVKCPFPSCNYKCSNKSTLRSHQAKYHTGIPNRASDATEGILPNNSDIPGSSGVNVCALLSGKDVGESADRSGTLVAQAHGAVTCADIGSDVSTVKPGLYVFLGTAKKKRITQHYV